MFYFDGKWKPMTKKITYTKEMTVYDTDATPYLDNPKFSNVSITDIALTDEQLARLEKVKRVETVGLYAVEQYVMSGVLVDSSIAMEEQIKQEDSRAVMLRHIKVEELSAEEINTLTPIFKLYESGDFYTVGEVVNLSGQLYKVLQAHTAQEDWNPASTPALYFPVSKPGTVGEWVQPYGGSGTYKLGAKVMFEGSMYENIYTGAEFNVWSPVAYPQGWLKI